MLQLSSSDRRKLVVSTCRGNAGLNCRAHPFAADAKTACCREQALTGLAREASQGLRAGVCDQVLVVPLQTGARQSACADGIEKLERTLLLAHPRRRSERSESYRVAPCAM
jgi:hypothetical protein